jgi:hypothetical protein
MSSSARSFGALARYLANGRTGDNPERVAWSTSRNLPTDEPELAGKIMRATAAQNLRVDKPVYHLALSFDPNDVVDRAAMERVANRVIAALRLQEHQVLIVSHGDRDHPHMHLLINRVHPETGLVWNRWQDRAVIQQVLREEEQALGLRAVTSRLTARQHEVPEERAVERTPAKGRGADIPSAVLSQTSESPERSSRGGRVEELITHLKTYERVAELSREHFPSEVEASASRARVSQLEEAIDRADRTGGAFRRALSQVYREPTEAQEKFSTVASEKGPEEAIRVMRERPEQMGALLTVEKSGAFGFSRVIDESATRKAAGVAAIAWRDAFEASVVLQETARSVQARRLEHTPRRETGVTPIPAPNGLLLPARIEPKQELDASRTHARLSAERETAIRRELTGAPGAADLERMIAGLLERMSPRETRQLHKMLTAPQLAVASRIRSAVRDAVLGREAEREA